MLHGPMALLRLGLALACLSALACSGNTTPAADNPLATLSCAAGQYVAWDGATWVCADPVQDTVLTEAEVDQRVANNGYLISDGETDPQFAASPAAGIAALDIAAWHAAAAYAGPWASTPTGLSYAGDVTVASGGGAPPALTVEGTVDTDTLVVNGELEGAGVNAMNMLAICAASNHADAPSSAYWSYVAWADDTMSCAEACPAANPSTNYGGPQSSGWRFFGGDAATLEGRIHHYTDTAAGGQPKFCCCRGGDNLPQVFCSAGAPAGCVVRPGFTP